MILFSICLIFPLYTDNCKIDEIADWIEMIDCSKQTELQMNEFWDSDKSFLLLQNAFAFVNVNLEVNIIYCCLL